MNERQVDPKPDPRMDFNNLKGYRTNAISEIFKTETEAALPVVSDENVEFAREWINENEL